MKPGRIYIAGPMRGRPEWNHPAFNRAAARFRSLGWEVENPVEIGERLCANDPNVAGGEYLKADAIAIATCEAIALLPDWQHSTGARCEVGMAITFGLAFYDAETAEPRHAPEMVIIRGGYEREAGPVDTLDALRSETIAWANATFTRSTPSSKAAHLHREATELRDDPTDVEEMADVFLLLAHLSDGCDLVGAVRAKMDKNKRRKWGEPDAEGVVEHVAEGVA